MVKTKKVLLFIVEGPTDETALGLMFERVFAEQFVVFDIVNGDLTTSDAWKGDVRQRVRERVIDHVDRQPYGWSDLGKVAQIVDTDGAYVPGSCVLESDGGELAYDEKAIYAPQVERIVRRNDQKRLALDTLASMRDLKYRKKSVPFEVYYMSRNLEHALHGEVANLSPDEKDRLARAFQTRFKQQGVEAFKRFLESDEVAIRGTYRETWNYIKQETHSLERGSNLHLVLPR